MNCVVIIHFLNFLTVKSRKKISDKDKFKKKNSFEWLSKKQQNISYEIH